MASMMAKKKAAKAKGSSAMVQVVLNQPVKSIGKKGDLVWVKPAYAENVIVRGGLGAIADAETLEHVAAENEAAAAAAVAAKQAAVQDSAKLETIFGEKGVVIKKNVGPDGALFGSGMQRRKLNPEPFAPNL